MQQSINTYKEASETPRVQVSPIAQKLEDVPVLDGPKITIAVYGFTDKTGQRKPAGNVASLSSAVTQGGEVWVMKGLQEVGDGSWFDVVERVGMDNLIKERQLIRNTREVYEKELPNGPTPLKPLRFAGLILEGGIVGYDANTAVGGVGARYLGIGAQTEYRVDTVTVVIRMVSVSTGRVMLSIATEKSIASTRSGVDVFKFLDLGTRAIESETGYSVNEPVNYAVRAAIECAIIELVYEGQKQGLWKFKSNEVKKVKVDTKTVGPHSNPNVDSALTKAINDEKLKELLNKKILWKYAKDLGPDDKYNFCDKDQRCFKTTGDLYTFETQQAHKKDGRVID